MEGGYSAAAPEPENEHDICPLIKRWNSDKAKCNKSYNKEVQKRNTPV